MFNDPMTFDDSELHSTLYSAQMETGNYGSGGDSTDTPQDSTPLATLPEKVNAVLSEFPGFGGLCLVVDKAEQFPGIEWFSPNTIIHLPRTGDSAINAVEGVIEGTATLLFAPQDYIGAAFYSVLRTIGDNLTPFFIRAIITSIGLLLVSGLIWKAKDGIISQFTGDSTTQLASKAFFAAG